MIYPPPIDSAAVAEHFKRSLAAAKRDDWPYRHWNLKEIYPEALCTGILALPVDPPRLGKTDGTRGTYNAVRTFFTPKMRADFAACAALCDALQRPDVAKLIGETCEFDVEGSYLRMEYIQDIDGSWLEPHHDIPEKLFSMVIYLCLGPDAKGWGTDIYDSNRRLVASASAELALARATLVPRPPDQALLIARPLAIWLRNHDSFGGAPSKGAPLTLPPDSI